MSTFKTTAAYVSGGICGPIWWPAGALCGMTLRADMRGTWAYPKLEKGDSFRDWLLSLLTHKGGDFQAASFTADTVLRVERRAVDGPGKYRIHVWERPIAELCADLVNVDAYTCNFIGED